MFQTRFIACLHHLYFIRALIELQRHCNKLYAKLKQEVVLLVRTRIRLSRLKGLGYRARDASLEERHFGYKKEQESSQGMCKNSGNVFINKDLNSLLVANQSYANNAAAISIPMQMFLLPFFVQPHGFADGDVKKADLAHVCNQNTICDCGSNSRIMNESQLWHEINVANVCAPIPRISLAQNKMISARPHARVAQNEHSTFMMPEQRNQIQFAPTSQRQTNQPTNVSPCNGSAANHYSAPWLTKRTLSSARGLNPGITMRNPLMN